MGSLIDGLLAFSRMGRAEMRKTRVSLDQLVREILAEVAADTSHRNIVWDISPLPDVDGDAALLRSVVANLISNAVKYTQQRSPAKIAIGTLPSPERKVVWFVRDNGVGFDMRYADKLFGVFQRLHRAEEFEGTGIGLATVQRIVHRHGGRIWAESEPNCGATFYVALPLLEN
jgi:light-regulated signal transduction histidine kinase (bacteriophytochrome)